MLKVFIRSLQSTESKALLKDEDTLVFMTKFFNKMYSPGVLPQDWFKSTFATLPKNSNSSDCNDYRTISLMSHILKIFLKIIHLRIYEKKTQMANSPDSKMALVSEKYYVL